MSDFFLADDLSGALDAAGAFHRAGRRVRIQLRADAALADATDEVIGITTETRNAASAEAARIVTATIARLTASGGRLLYKKIDSTLRGPVAAEVAALSAALPGTRILFCPANPAVGRTVREGRLLVHGVPVAETDFAQDPISPVRESVIARLLGSAGGPRVTIPDAESAADLAAAVERAANTAGPWVAIGSGALAVPVAARGAKAPTTGSLALGAAANRGPVLMLGGSSHAANREQAAVLSQERGVPGRELDVDGIGPAVAAAHADLATHRLALLQLPAARTDSGRALRAMTTAARQIIESTGVRRVFATGGETAFALAAELGISSLEFAAELEPGLSVSRGESRHGRMWLAVKPGGFGGPRTWLNAWQALGSTA